VELDGGEGGLCSALVCVLVVADDAEAEQESEGRRSKPVKLDWLFGRVRS
jgi:hypothetical protein